MISTVGGRSGDSSYKSGGKDSCNRHLILHAGKETDTGATKDLTEQETATHSALLALAKESHGNRLGQYSLKAIRFR